MTAAYRYLLLLSVALLSVFNGWASRGQAAHDTGNGRIAGCPPSPNCVSSASPAGDHWIAPLTFNTSQDEAIRCLEQIIRGMKRATIVVSEAGYIRAEFRTFLGFVDDVEFQVDSGKRTVLMRSASRTGYWDLGMNRRRLEAIRVAFDSKCRQERPPAHQ